jgi:peptide chain release factor subunit 1
MGVIQAGELRQLTSFHSREHPVVSLYLNVTPPRPFVSELSSLIHTKLQDLKGSKLLSKDQLRTLEETLAKVKESVKGLERELKGTRLLVIFASPEGLWQVYRLPVALPSRLIVEPDPYIRPLSLLLDEFYRYCVLVVDARKARIFSLFLGEIEEHLGLFEDEVPGKVRVGGWAGLAEKRIQRHIEDKVHHHLKKVAERTFQFFKEREFALLIVGGPQDKTIPYLLDHLHSYLQQRLAGTFAARPEEKIAQLKEKALGVAQDYERREEEQLIARLLQENKPGGKGVLGLEPTLESLMLGQIHTLIIEHDFRVEGFLCPNDHYLSSYQQQCPLCGSKLEAVEDLADEIVEEALQQGAEVEHVFTEHEAFSNHGIGALLRFTL